MQNNVIDANATVIAADNTDRSNIPIVRRRSKKITDLIEEFERPISPTLSTLSTLSTLPIIDSRSTESVVNFGCGILHCPKHNAAAKFNQNRHFITDVLCIREILGDDRVRRLRSIVRIESDRHMEAAAEHKEKVHQELKHTKSCQF